MPVEVTVEDLVNIRVHLGDKISGVYMGPSPAEDYRELIVLNVEPSDGPLETDANISSWRSVWLKPSLWAKAVQRESVINTHLTPGTASTTSANLLAINELSNSLSPTSKLLTLVLAVMMLLEYRPLTDSEKDLQYPMVPYASIPPSNGNMV